MKLHKMLRDFLNILSEFYIGCVEKLRQILTLGSKSLTNRQYLAIDVNLQIANHDPRAALNLIHHSNSWLSINFVK